MSLSYILATIKDWLIINKDWLEPLGVIIPIATGIYIYLRKKIYLGLKKTKNNSKKETLIPKTEVTFVVMAHRTLWNMGSRDGKPCMQINISWYITNASNVPIQILSTGLVKPKTKGKICTSFITIVDEENVAHFGLNRQINAKQTRQVDTLICGGCIQEWYESDTQRDTFTFWFEPFAK